MKHKKLNAQVKIMLFLLFYSTEVEYEAYSNTLETTEAHYIHSKKINIQVLL